MICSHDSTLWEGLPVRTYQDGSASVGHSIVVSPDRKTQVNGAMCGLIALVDADSRWIHNVTGASSPWALFKFLTMLGWTFKAGSMLEATDFTNIGGLLECSVRVQYKNLNQVCGSGHVLTIRARGAHFLNGDEL